MTQAGIDASIRMAHLLRLAAVLLVADLLQPIDIPAVERFLNGNMRHRHRRRGTDQRDSRPAHAGYACSSPLLAKIELIANLKRLNRWACAIPNPSSPVLTRLSNEQEGVCCGAGRSDCVAVCRVLASRAPCLGISR